MPLKLIQRYTREDISKNLEDIYVFGDNMERRGMGGQALVARHMPNVVGIPTKWRPSNFNKDYFADSDYDFVAPVILGEFRKLYHYIKVGKTVYWPLDGIGTGLARLAEKAPRIRDLIDSSVQRLSLYDTTGFD